MDAVFGVLLVLASFSSPFVAWGINEAVFNVTDYGAISDSRTDNSQAFLKAWDAACKASVQSSTLYVPPGTSFLINPITFNGPCNAPTIKFSNLGSIIAPDSLRLWDGKDPSQWLSFTNINGLSLDGSGTIDGKGKAWWDQSCKHHPELKNCTVLAPTAMKFVKCNESMVTNIKFQDSAQVHILVVGCNNFNIHNVTIDSPGNSPNTDGIHIQSSQHVTITNSTIANGDDCILIGDQTSDLNISYIQCSLGHGIRDGNFVQVQNINVTDCIFNDTTNGARIKTWQVGRGFAKYVAFERLTFNNVENPIIIDQNYCDSPVKCPQQKTGVQISNVTYRGAVGTSASEIAIKLDCSNAVPCHGISLESVQLTSATAGKQVTANCSNAYGEEDAVIPGPCLLHENQSKSKTPWNKILQYLSDVPTI